MLNLLRSLIAGVEKTSGTPCDLIVVNSDERAVEVKRALLELDRDMHVMIDDELSPKTILVTSHQALGLFPGSGRN